MLSDVFIKKIKQQMKILYIIKKKPSTIIRLQPLSSQDYLIQLDDVTSWSKNNKKLYQLILENGMAEFICNWPYLYQFYNQLVFSNLKINKIDTITLQFSNLQQLNLVQNNIQRLQNLPQNLKILYIDFNQISQIELKSKLSLQMLSISHNFLDDKCMKKICQNLTQLRVLNVSYNKLEKIQLFSQQLKNLTKLRVIYYSQNPMQTLSQCNDILIKQIKQLTMINGKQINRQKSINQKNKS